MTTGTSPASPPAAAGRVEQFSSEGFDLDALGGSGQGGDVIYEVGGGATVATAPAADKSSGDEEGNEEPEEEDSDPLSESERHKAEGNSHFKNGEYLDAYDCYTDAIGSCPGGPTGEELLRMNAEWEEEERERAAERHREETERRRRKEVKEGEERRNKMRERMGEGGDAGAGIDGSGNGGSDCSDDGSDSDGDQKEEESSSPPNRRFDPPAHPHASTLAIYHANRAAASLHLDRPDECAEDCTVALLLNPNYVKAYLRRMAAHEKMDNTEDALQDAKSALQLDPTNVSARKNVARLQKIEDERMEKLKEETMGKLKDLGNSILGNFGLSLDNFKAVKDENTGSYSISFDQNAGGGAGGGG